MNFWLDMCSFSADVVFNMLKSDKKKIENGISNKDDTNIKEEYLTKSQINSVQQCKKVFAIVGLQAEI
jgi:hypothetical protein